MAFQPGRSGNPGGRKRSLGLSRAVRKSDGQKSWAWLCKAGDEQVLERKEIGRDKEGLPIMVDVVPSVKVLLDVHKLKLAYCMGPPRQKLDVRDDFRLQTGEYARQLLAVVVNVLLRGEVGVASLTSTSVYIPAGRFSNSAQR